MKFKAFKANIELQALGSQPRTWPLSFMCFTKPCVAVRNDSNNCFKNIIIHEYVNEHFT